MFYIKVILIVLCTILLWLVVVRIIRKLYHFPAPAFIGRFLDSDFRRWAQPPDKQVVTFPPSELPVADPHLSIDTGGSLCQYAVLSAEPEEK